MKDDLLMQSIQNMEAERDKYPYGSENWKFYNSDVERMRKELWKRNEDDNYPEHRNLFR